MTKYKYSLKENSFFINPYNFIPIGTKDNKSEYSEGNRTGVLKCKLFTKTPLAVLDTESAITNENKNHNSYKFYSLNGRYAIPGSSLRGAIRSMHEAINDSCMSTVKEKQILTTRLNTNKSYSPCILIETNGKWQLFDAKRIAIVCSGEDERCRYRDMSNSPYTKFNVKYDGKEKYIEYQGEEIYWGDRVSVTKEGTGYRKNDGKNDRKNDRKNEHPIWVWSSTVEEMKKDENGEYYVYIGELISNKHAESVFQKGEKQKIPQEKLDIAMRKLEATLDIYRDKAINKKYEENHYGYSGYERVKKSGAIPLWYNNEGNVLHLSLAAIGKIAYENEMMDLVGVNRRPCSDKQKLCQTCEIFGMTSNNDCLGGRVRVTDAICENLNPIPHSYSLKELATPRTSFLNFYSQDGKDYDDANSMIRGRKFYWHNPIAAEKDDIFKNAEQTKLNATVEILNDQSFDFDVHYNNLTDEQLISLIQAITLGENSESSKLMYKIGHGKPLGLGSSKIVIEKMIERDISSGYKLIEYHGDEIPNKELVNDDLRKMVSFVKRRIPICYPFVESDGKEYAGKNDLAAHKAFKCYKDEKIVLPNVRDIESPNKALSSCIATPNDSNKSNRGYRNNRNQR